MSDLVTVAQHAFDVLSNNTKLQVTVNGQVQKIACAFPRGADPADFGPWTQQEVRQVFFEQDVITTAAVELDFRFTWTSSAALQYVDDVFVGVLPSIATGYSLDASVEFRPPQLGANSDGLEMARIPFIISVTRSHPLLGIKGFRAEGFVQGDGNGNIQVFQSIAA